MITPDSFPILLVDDDPAIAELLTRAARSNFPEARFLPVSSFAEAAQFVANLDGEGPKLVLLDIDLQTGPDGFAFLSLLRNHPQGRRLPVVMLSSSDEPEQVDKALTLGASAFTSKPFIFREWKDYVAQLRSYWYDTILLPTIWFNKGLPT